MKPVNVAGSYRAYSTLVGLHYFYITSKGLDLEIMYMNVAVSELKTVSTKR